MKPGQGEIRLRDPVWMNFGLDYWYGDTNQYIAAINCIIYYIIPPWLNIHPNPNISALADDPHPDCECENNFKDISQNGFTIFATWMCKHCGCGCVRVQWCQKKITAFDCNCNQEYTFFCVHVKVSL